MYISPPVPRGYLSPYPVPFGFLDVTPSLRTHIVILLILRSVALRTGPSVANWLALEGAMTSSCDARLAERRMLAPRTSRKDLKTGVDSGLRLAVGLCDSFRRKPGGGNVGECITPPVADGVYINIHLPTSYVKQLPCLARVSIAYHSSLSLHLYTSDIDDVFFISPNPLSVNMLPKSP
jgi:hypothetical protein